MATLWIVLIAGPGEPESKRADFGALPRMLASISSLNVSHRPAHRYKYEALTHPRAREGRLTVRGGLLNEKTWLENMHVCRSQTAKLPELQQPTNIP